MTRARLLAVIPNAIPLINLAAFDRQYPGARIGNGQGGFWVTTDGHHCGCHKCFDALAAEYRALTDDWLSPGFIVCETCGNKRCPKASDHENECTGSNEPGQPGSVYEETNP